MAGKHDVDPELVDAFNAACADGRDGRNESALQRYRSVVSRAGRPGVAAGPEFIATARMRAGFCLMDLNRHQEALVEFAEARRQASHLDLAGRYELAFATGNSWGALRRLPECFSSLVEAISLAEDMDDYGGRPTLCWVKILEHGSRAGDRAFVAEKAAIALNTALLRNLPYLADVARQRMAQARGA